MTTPTDARREEVAKTDDQIKYMVSRFLAWRLPQPWHPDGGITYQRPNYAHAPSEHDWPVGTNLFDAEQAEAMIRYMLEGSAALAAAEPGDAERVRHLRHGATFKIVGEGKLQTERVLSDMAELVAYRSETDGSLWFRPPAEFRDGRFETLARAIPIVPRETGAEWQPIERLLKALKPFAARVFDDNGDCTVSDTHLCKYDDYVLAKKTFSNVTHEFERADLAPLDRAEADARDETTLLSMAKDIRDRLTPAAPSPSATEDEALATAARSIWISSWDDAAEGTRDSWRMITRRAIKLYHLARFGGDPGEKIAKLEARLAVASAVRPTVWLASQSDRIAELEADVKRLREWERKTVHEGMKGASRYWEGRWRDDQPRIAELEAQIAAKDESGFSGEVYALFRERENWSADEIIKRTGADNKKVYNALSYLNRTERIHKTGYGSYTRAALQNGSEKP